MKAAKQLIQEGDKREIIKLMVNDYTQTFKVDDKLFKFSPRQIETYTKELEKLNYKQIKSLQKYAQKTTLRYKLIDGIKRIVKKKHSALAVLVRRNGTVTNHVFDARLKTFTLEDKEYLVMPSNGYRHINNKLSCFFFYEGVPVPFNITEKGYKFIDAEAIKKVFDMKYLEAMTQIADLEKFFKMSLVLSGLSLFLSIIIIAILAKNSGVF